MTTPAAPELLGAYAPAYPDFPPLGAGALADADRVRAGRFRLVGEEYDLGATFSWTMNPSRDKEWQIAQHKHYWAVHLVHAATVHDDPTYLDTLSTLTASWLDEMGTGFIAQSDAQVEAKRIESWVWALSLLPAAPWQGHVDPALLQRLVVRLGEEAVYVAAHLKPVRNHRTFELYAVALAGVLLPDGDETGTLRTLAVGELTRNLLAEVGPDGVHVEMSTHYHQLVAETAVGFLELCDRNGILLDPALPERVHEALRWSLWLQWPDGDIPLLGDSDTGDHRDLLRRGSALFDDDELLYGATLGARGRPPARPSRRFDASGYVVLTDGWGHDPATHAARQHVVFDTAALGEGSHSHYDLLSFTYYADGGPALVDPGRFTYSSDPDELGHDWRHHFKSTTAHNTVTVDGLDQTHYLSRTKHGPEATVADATHHSGLRTDWAAGTALSQEYSPVHRRTVVFPDRRYLLLVDRLVGVDGASHSYDLRLHLPDLQAELDRADRPDERQLQLRTPRCVVTCAPPPDAVAEVAGDWVSRLYGVKEPGAVLQVSTTSADDVWFVTAVAPRSGPDVQRVRRVTTPEGLAVQVSGVDRGEPFEDVMLVSTGSRITGHGVSLNGRWCLVRRDGGGRAVHVVGEAVSQVLVDGTPLPAAPGASLEWSA
jgi:Heparinase II/III-like protein/Heparinase II/III N-terminus